MMKPEVEPNEASNSFNCKRHGSGLVSAAVHDGQAGASHTADGNNHSINDAAADHIDSSGDRPAYRACYHSEGVDA